MKKLVCVFAVAWAFVGCRPQWSGDSQAIPTPIITPILTDDVQGGGEFQEELAVVESVDVLILESFPVQVNVLVSGYIPDGCTELGRMESNLTGSNFAVELYTQRPRDAVCTQVVQEFEKSIPLDVQGVAAGDYTVTVNGKEAGFSLDVDNVIEGQL